EIIESLRDAQREIRPDGDPRREAAVTIPASEPRVRAEVLAPAGAEPARAVDGGEPRGTGPLPDLPAGDLATHLLHASHRLVAGHDRQSSGLQVALHQLEIGPAHRTRAQTQDELVRSRLGIRELDDPQRRLACRAGVVEL